MKAILLTLAVIFAMAAVPTVTQAEYETGRPCSEYVGTPDFWICIGNQGG